MTPESIIRSNAIGCVLTQMAKDGKASMEVISEIYSYEMDWETFKLFGTALDAYIGGKIDKKEFEDINELISRQRAELQKGRRNERMQNYSIECISDEDVNEISETMPVLSYLRERVDTEPFKGKGFIIILHFLKDLIPFMKCCEKFGLDPSETILFYKEYLYPHRRSITDYFEKNYSVNSLDSIDEVLSKFQETCQNNWKPIIIIEDGGYVVPRVHTDFKALGKQTIGAIEQTTRGVRNDKEIEEFEIPVISVAGSDLKNQFEPPHVARAVIKNIQQLLSEINFSSKSALVIGYGSIGKEIAIKLKDSLGMNVTISDQDPNKLVGASQDGFMTAEFPDAVKDKFLVVGATGETSIRRRELLAMNHNVYLVSASSDQKEIGLTELEALKSNKEELVSKGKKIGTRYVIRTTTKVINLIADGYPINFWAEESMPNQVSDLIMSLILVSAIELAQNYRTLPKDISSDKVNEYADKYELSRLYLDLYRQP